MFPDKFKKAVETLLRNEGGYTNDPDDPGGRTNFGITQKLLSLWYKQLMLPADVKKLTKEDAILFYYFVFWDKYHYDTIPSDEIAAKVFDFSVNMGPYEAHKITQKAANHCGYNLKVDGIIGKKTMHALKEISQHNRADEFIKELESEAVNYYIHISEENPKLYKFLKGWINRTNAKNS